MKNCAWARGRCEVIAMIYRRTSVRRASLGQSMIETVLMLPLLLLLLLNAVNFGFYFFVTLNLTAAPRTSAEYSTMGFDTPSALSLPDSGPPSGTLTSSYITQQDMTGAVYNPTAASIQICSETNLDTTTKSGVNGSGSTQRTNCVTCTGTTCTSPAAVTTGNLAPHPDPEAPSFILHRVDVTYAFAPLIPGTPFNLAVLAACGSGYSCTFHRYAEMRAMN